MSTTFASLDIVANWGRLNDTIIHLVDVIPDDKLNWSPKAELWNFKGSLIHICGARHGWISGDRADSPKVNILSRPLWADIIREAQTKDGIKRHLASSWETVAGFVASPDKLAATYDDHGTEVSGHWIAYHLLEHDIHHRSDLFHYLALLDIEHPEVGTP